VESEQDCVCAIRATTATGVTCSLSRAPRLGRHERHSPAGLGRCGGRGSDHNRCCAGGEPRPSARASPIATQGTTRTDRGRWHQAFDVTITLSFVPDAAENRRRERRCDCTAASERDRLLVPDVSCGVSRRRREPRRSRCDGVSRMGRGSGGAKSKQVSRGRKARNSRGDCLFCSLPGRWKKVSVGLSLEESESSRCPEVAISSSRGIKVA
jgi:hypothetical protein